MFEELGVFGFILALVIGCAMVAGAGILMWLATQLLMRRGGAYLVIAGGGGFVTGMYAGITCLSLTSLHNFAGFLISAVISGVLVGGLLAMRIRYVENCRTAEGVEIVNVDGRPVERPIRQNGARARASRRVCGCEEVSVNVLAIQKQEPET